MYTIINNYNYNNNLYLIASLKCSEPAYILKKNNTIQAYRYIIHQENVI